MVKEYIQRSERDAWAEAVDSTVLVNGGAEGKGFCRGLCSYLDCSTVITCRY